MRREFDEEDEPKKSTRGKKNNQKMKPFLVYQYLMRHTDENHVIRADDICLAMAETYGIDAVFCKPFLDKVAKHFWTLLHVQIGQNCKVLVSLIKQADHSLADII